MTEKEKRLLDLIGRCERLENNLEVVSGKVDSLLDGDPLKPSESELYMYIASSRISGILDGLKSTIETLKNAKEEL